MSTATREYRWSFTRLVAFWVVSTIGALGPIALARPELKLLPHTAKYNADAFDVVNWASKWESTQKFVLTRESGITGDRIVTAPDGTHVRNNIETDFKKMVAEKGNESPLVVRLRGVLFHAGYAHLRKGDIIRAMDRLYRLQPPTNRDWLRFEAVHDEEVPPGLVPTPGCCSIPIDGAAGFHLLGVTVVAYGRWHWVQTIQRGRPNAPKLRPAVVVRIGNNGMARNRPEMSGIVGFGRHGTVRKTDSFQKVTEGDLLWFGKYAHRVRKIVLPDPERHIVGWVDIDRDPTEVKQLKPGDETQNAPAPGDAKPTEKPKPKW